MPLFILAGGIVLLFVLIIGFRFNSFLSLIIVSLSVGLAQGLPLTQVFTSIENGVGGTLGHLALVISFGAMLGRLMSDSGGAQRIAVTLIDQFGRSRVKWAVCLTGFVVGIALFYEVGFVLLIPLAFTIAASAKIKLLEVGLPMAAALSVTHGFLPPHPGPTAIAVIYSADIGLTLVYGILISIPTVILAGPLLYHLLRDLDPKAPETLHNPTVFQDDEMPSFRTSLLTALVPVFLMAGASIAKIALAPASPFNAILGFLGHPDMALLLAVVIAMFTFGINRGKSMAEVMKTLEESVIAIAMILLVVGGGGAFKQILIDSGVGQYIADLMRGSAMSPLILAWLIASVIRVAVGSATVAALTTGGIAAPLIPLTGVSPELMVLATGAGSLNVGPPNDPGFWMFKEFFGLTMKETVKSWCSMEIIIAVMGLVGVLAINAFL